MWQIGVASRLESSRKGYRWHTGLLWTSFCVFNIFFLFIFKLHEYPVVACRISFPIGKIKCEGAVYVIFFSSQNYIEAGASSPKLWEGDRTLWLSERSERNNSPSGRYFKNATTIDFAYFFDNCMHVVKTHLICLLFWPLYVWNWGPPRLPTFWTLVCMK